LSITGERNCTIAWPTEVLMSGSSVERIGPRMEQPEKLSGSSSMCTPFGATWIDSSPVWASTPNTTSAATLAGAVVVTFMVHEATPPSQLRWSGSCVTSKWVSRVIGPPSGAVKATLSTWACARQPWAAPGQLLVSQASSDEKLPIVPKRWSGMQKPWLKAPSMSEGSAVSSFASPDRDTRTWTPPSMIWSLGSGAGRGPSELGPQPLHPPLHP
jgi:hypothetical protein